MPAPASSSLRIRKVRLRYRVPKHYPKAERVRAELDELAARQLASECGRSCERLFPEGDGSIWFIRRLAVQVRLHPGHDHHTHLRRCAAEIARALARSLADGPNEDVICFKTYGEYLAQFLRDHSRQRAWSQWFYREFETLRSLPSSAVVVEALLRQPESAEEALVRLYVTGDLEPLLHQLTDRQSERILAALHPAGTPGQSPDAAYLSAVVNEWAVNGLARPGSGNLSGRDSLRLWIAVRSKHPELSQGERLGSAMTSLGDFIELFPKIAEPGHFEYLVGRGEVSEAALLVPEGSRHCVRAFARHPELLAELVQRIAPKQAATASGHSSEGTFPTPFGGAFLLLRVWVDLGLEELAREEGLALPDGWNKGALFRLITLLKCMGRSWLDQAICDRALRLAAGFEPGISLPELREWLETAGPPDRLLRRFCALMHSLGHLRGDILRLRILDRSNDSVAVLQDLPGGFWIDAGTLAHETSLAAWLERRLAMTEEATGEAARYLVLEPSRRTAALENLDHLRSAELLWETSLGAEPPHGLQCHALNGNGQLWSRSRTALPPEFRSVWARSARSARFCADDLDHFDLGGGGPFSVHPMHLAWSVVASGLMRSFARRLMGFDGSSASYLCENFLAGTSFVSVQSHSIEVALPRVPLDVVLRVSGLDGQTFPQPSHPDRLIELRLPRLSSEPNGHARQP